MLINAFFTIIFLVTAFLFFAPNLLDAGWSSNLTVLLLVAVVLAYAAARAKRWSAVKAIIRVGFPVAALLIFAVKQGAGDPAAVTSIIGGVLLNVIALFGIFLMVYGAFSKKSKSRRNREDD